MQPLGGGFVIVLRQNRLDTIRRKIGTEEQGVSRRQKCSKFREYFRGLKIGQQAEKRKHAIHRQVRFNEFIQVIS